MKEDKISQIPSALDVIDDKLKDWENDIRLDGKNLQSAVVEQPSLLAYYDQVAVQSSYLLDYMEMKVKKVRAERLRFIKDNFGRDYNDTTINKVIEGDKEYVRMQEIFIEVKQVYDKCKSIVDAFKQRSYSLNNLVKIHEAELENITIRL